MTTEQYLLELIKAKNDMKVALREKGVEVWGGLNTYPDAIRKLKAADELLVYNGTKFWNSTWIVAPLMNTSNVTDMSVMFAHCTSLITIPQLDISRVTDMSNMFANCTSLKYVKFKGAPTRLDDVDSIFEDCNGLTIYYPNQFVSYYEPIIQELEGKGDAVGYNE